MIKRRIVRHLGSGITAGLLFMLPIAGRAAEPTTIMCTYRAPHQPGNPNRPFPIALDLAKEIIPEWADLFDGDMTTNAPLTISDETIAWTANDSSRMILDRTTLILSYDYHGFGPIPSFDCAVVHKQL